MALNFPSNPTTNATYTFNDKTWTYTGNAWALVSTSLTTSAVEEGSNLYFTNARVYANIAPLLTTANVTESTSNLYYTNTRVNAFVQPYLTTANVLESNTSLYYTNARVLAHLANSNVSTKFLTVTGNIYATENVTTSKSLVLSKNADSPSAATGTDESQIMAAFENA